LKTSKVKKDAFTTLPDITAQQRHALQTVGGAALLTVVWLGYHIPALEKIPVPSMVSAVLLWHH
jgi:hypothetical protein